MQIRHGEYIFSRGEINGKSKLKENGLSISGCLQWELYDMLKPERSQVGSKVAFRSLWYMGTWTKCSGTSLSPNCKKIQVPWSCQDGKIFEHRLWAKPGLVIRKDSAECSWFLSQNWIWGLGLPKAPWAEPAPPGIGPATCWWEIPVKWKEKMSWVGIKALPMKSINQKRLPEVHIILHLYQELVQNSSRGLFKIKTPQVWSDFSLEFLPSFKKFVTDGLLKWTLTHSY